MRRINRSPRGIYGYRQKTLQFGGQLRKVLALMRTIVDCALGAAILLMMNFATSLSVNAEDVMRDGIVRVEVRGGQTERGPYIRIGTGFLVGDRGFALTARHLFQPDSPWARTKLLGSCERQST